MDRAQGNSAPPGAIQVAIPVAELPEPYVPSWKRSCSRCGQEVWISLGAFPLADELSIICMTCLVGVVGGG